MKQDNELKLIPVFEQYMEYMLQVMIKLPRTEKFSIGTEYKQVMYSTIENILYLNKVEKSKRMAYLNRIDAEINTQRVLLRVMKNSRWIDLHKFDVAMDYLYEIGKILGGLIKYYAKDIKK